MHQTILRPHNRFRIVFAVFNRKPLETLKYTVEHVYTMCKRLRFQILINPSFYKDSFQMVEYAGLVWTEGQTGGKE